MLCQFLLYSKVNQLYVYIYPLFFRFFSHVVYYRILSRVPCAIQQVLVDYLFYIQQFVYVKPELLIYPSPKYGTLHEFACHPCAGGMLICSVSFQFQYMCCRSEHSSFFFYNDIHHTYLLALLGEGVCLIQDYLILGALS